MSNRKMASIRRIDKIEPIEGADKIVCATVGGWKLVTAIDNGFKVGDLVVYLEIDSWVPTKLAPFLTKPGHFPKTFNGVEGEKLRSVKLRGQVSQGLLLPMTVISKALGVDCCPSDVYQDGTDVSELLGIQKHEPPVNAQLAGIVKGNFPSAIPKTDQERIQNLSQELEEYKKMKWEMTEKLEGSSATFYFMNGVFGVCSRNLDLKQDKNNTFWKVAIEANLENKLKSIGKDIAVQAELIGPGIQGNIYKLSEPEFRVFDVYDIQNGEYLNSFERLQLCDTLGLSHTPVLHKEFDISNETMETLISMADGKSELFDTRREGIVFKSVTDPSVSFKCISNEYLVKQKD